MAVVLTIPQTAIPVSRGAFYSNYVDSGLVRLIVTVTKVAWPNTNGKASDLSIEASFDSGSTWRELMKVDLNDIGGANSTITFGCGLPRSQSTTRRIRLAYSFAKALTISGNVQAV